MLDAIQNTIERLVWGDRFEKLGRLGRALAVVLRYLYGMLRDVFSNQLTLRAMSLVYTTLLSIVPLLAVSFSLAKGLGMVARLREVFTQSFTQLGPDGVAIAENILQMVDRINGRAIGAIGVVFFLWTAVSMIQKVESSFNFVWYVGKSRSLKGVLEPFSTQGNIDLLKRAGFVDIVSVSKFVCFEGFLAIK